MGYKWTREKVEEKGVLIVENKRQTSSKQPDLIGHFMLNGEKYEIGFWAKQFESGETFLTGKIRTMGELKVQSEVRKKDKTGLGLKDILPS